MANTNERLNKLEQAVASQQRALEELHSHFESLRKTVESCARLLIGITVPGHPHGEGPGRN